MEWLLERYYSSVAQIALVQDNLNTYTYGAFYDHLPADQIRRMAEKLDFHFTPKHGSWLNMSEIEFSALARECLDRRIESLEKLEKEVQNWSRDRNQKQTIIHWSFTVDAAREKLARKYQQVNISNSKN